MGWCQVKTGGVGKRYYTGHQIQTAFNTTVPQMDKYWRLEVENNSEMKLHRLLLT